MLQRIQKHALTQMAKEEASQTVEEETSLPPVPAFNEGGVIAGPNNNAPNSLMIDQQEVLKQASIHAPNLMTKKSAAQDIVDQVQELFGRAGGYATVRYNNDTECLEFRGGPKVAHDVTIHQSEKSIMHFAMTYVARVKVDHKDRNGVYR